MIKTTKGPWYVTGNRPGNIHIGSMSSPMVMASMNPIHIDTPANARVMAASEQLLAVLRVIVKNGDEYASMDPAADFDDIKAMIEYGEAFDAARKIIADLDAP